jgi:hypothetical protein
MWVRGGRCKFIVKKGQWDFGLDPLLPLDIYWIPPADVGEVAIELWVECWFGVGYLALDP